MDPTLLIFACIALGAAATFFVVVAIVAVKAGRDLDRITSVVESTRNDVAELKKAAIPVIEKAGTVLDRMETDLQQLSKGAASIAGIAEDVRQLEQSLLARVRPSLEDLASLVSGLAKGVTTFARNLLDR